MDLEKNLFSTKKKKGLGKASAASMVAHVALIGVIVLGGARASHDVKAEEKIQAFITQGAAPPPPPPPPPAPAASSAPKAQPRITPPKVQPVQQTFVQPREIPKEVPKVEPIPVTKDAIVDLTPDPEPLPSGGADLGAVAGAQPGGVAGGVEGGQAGGVVGGQVGGVVGGEVGGQVGGVVGGKLGGEVGGTGTGTEGSGTGGNDAPVVPAPAPEPPPAPSGPLRVGGNVKAPVAINRSEPEYTETARAAKVAGIVVVEAIIDKQGNVDAVKVVKGLPMGLSEAAVKAVRQWKFKPGTLNGEPVATIFNLTVNFKLN